MVATISVWTLNASYAKAPAGFVKTIRTCHGTVPAMLPKRATVEVPALRVPHATRAMPRRSRKCQTDTCR